MNPLRKSFFAALVAFVLSFTSVFAGTYNLEKSTPVGSWQLREEITTDAKGKQSIMVVKTSLVGEEKRGGVDYVWVESAVDTFKMKKGKKGKQVGDHMVLKILMEKKLLNGEPEDVFNNLRGLGEEIIMQSGDQDPMKIEKGGMMGGAMLQAMGTEINYDFQDKGKETVDTPAGKFKCKVVEGSGTVEMKIVFKKMTVNGTSKQWLSDDVPFGMVKTESTSEMNGDMSTTQGTLIDFGKKGAVSEIKGNPEAVQIPGLGSLFGN